MNFFGKSYNEIEGELNETKSKIQLLEEKIEYLIQKDIDMTKILCETNCKIQQLEEKLQKNTSSLISFTSNSLEIGPLLTSKTMFIDINCSKIIINADQKYGSVIIIDEAHNGVETEKGQKFLNKFKDTRKIFISGTPQKQLGKLQFNDENTFIYDEVSQKKDKENGIWSDAIILKIQLIKILSDSVIDYKKCICDVTGYFTFKKFFSNNKNKISFKI